MLLETRTFLHLDILECQDYMWLGQIKVLTHQRHIYRFTDLNRITLGGGFETRYIQCTP